MGSKEGSEAAPMIHSPYFNFPDSLTPVAAYMWASLIADRLK